MLSAQPSAAAQDPKARAVTRSWGHGTAGGGSTGGGRAGFGSPRPPSWKHITHTAPTPGSAQQMVPGATRHSKASRGHDPGPIVVTSLQQTPNGPSGMGSLPVDARCPLVPHTNPVEEPCKALHSSMDFQ